MDGSRPKVCVCVKLFFTLVYSLSVMLLQCCKNFVCECTRLIYCVVRVILGPVWSPVVQHWVSGVMFYAQHDFSALTPADGHSFGLIPGFHCLYACQELFVCLILCVEWDKGAVVVGTLVGYWFSVLKACLKAKWHDLVFPPSPLLHYYTSHPDSYLICCWVHYCKQYFVWKSTSVYTCLIGKLQMI